MLAASLVAFLSSNQFGLLKLAFNYADPFSISEYRLRHLSKEAYEASIEEALAEGDLADAQSLVELALASGHELPIELIERTVENPLEFGWRHVQEVLEGAYTGEISSASSVGGVLAADYFGVGDLRDIAIQGTQYARGEDYDPVTLGFALVGVTTSAAIMAGSVATGGAGTVIAGPALVVDGGAAIIKNANKMRKLSAPLRGHITRIFSKMIDMQGLKKGLSEISFPTFKMPSATQISSSARGIKWGDVMAGDFSSIQKLMSDLLPVDLASANKALEGAIRPEELRDAKALAGSVGTLMTSGGFKTAFRAMEHADDVGDLSRFQKLSSKMGRKSAAVIKVLGKGAIKLGKLAYLIATVLLSGAVWVVGALWVSYSVVRTTARALKSVREAM